MAADTNPLFMARLTDIILGSAIGAIGSWVLFNERVHYLATVQLRKARLIMKKSRLK